MSADAPASKNEILLKEFVAHCEQHPGETFWFVLVCDDIEGSRTIDTFYWEGKDGSSG